MSVRSQAILSQIKALPPDEQREVCSQVLVTLAGTQPPAATADPVLSARGMFAGGRLNAALVKHRREERDRG